MSYARWGADGSDVYVYADWQGGIVCCGCFLNLEHYESDHVDVLGIHHHAGEIAGGVTQRFHDADSLIEHFKEHLLAGHIVPPDLLISTTYDEDDFPDRGP